MQSRPQADRNEPWRVAAVCIFLATIVLLVFGQTRHFEFVNLDDDLIVYENPHVMQGLSAGGIGWAFTHYDSNFYTPLTTISHMLDWQLFGAQAGPHHVVNILLHIAAACVLFLALRSMTGAFWRSAFVAAIFAVHPLHVESVAWVAERKDVLSGLFFMLTLWAYAGYTRQRSAARYLLVLAAFTTSLLCKPVAVTLPFLLLLLDYWPLGRFDRDAKGARSVPVSRLVLEKVPMLALSIVASVIAVLAEGDAVQSTTKYLISSRIANALVSCATYITQMFYPVRMSAFYPYPGIDLPVWEITLSFLGLLFATVIIVLLRRRYRYLFTGWLWYLGMLVPMIGVVQVGSFARADRFTYLTQIGLYIMGTWGFAEMCAKWERRRLITGTAMGMLMVELIVIARLQASYWKNSEKLWNHALECDPANAFAHNDLGQALCLQGRMDEGLPHFEEALKVNPLYAYAHSNLAAAFYRTGRRGEAMDHVQQALQINPRIAEARNLFANMLSENGEVKEAVAQYEKALELKPEYDSALSNLAWLLATYPDDSVRNGPRAVQLANAANRVSGGRNAKILRTLAAAYAETGQFSTAEETAGRAVAVAGEHGVNGLVPALRSEIRLYQSHTPYRQKVNPAKKTP